MLDIPSISALVAAVGVIVGVVFAYLEVKSLVKTRQTDLVIRLHSTLGRSEFLEAWARFFDREITDYESYKKKYGFMELNMLEVFFSEIGVLLRRNLKDIGLVEDFFSVEVERFWGKLKPFAEDVRQIRKSPKPFSNVEYLYNEMQKREETLQTQQ